MRPVRLEMEGFAAFRERAVVDFTGAEYFALVGPTGSGKSTVIDALTFALYGTVPRWDDRRAVALALAPSVVRGVVRLVFDVRGGRFVAVRELRRAARGGVNVKNARLERLLDRDDVDGDTEVLAADSGVTKAVEELLGLPFEHFTSCVVLPQGEFAEFLHAKPGDRQAILTRLLGLGVYERIAREANREAAAAGDRAALLAEQLGAYVDATDEAVAEAGGGWSRWRRWPSASGRCCRRCRWRHRRSSPRRIWWPPCGAEQARLGALRAPDGLEELDARRRGAGERVRAARVRFTDAEAADDTARALRRGGTGAGTTGTGPARPCGARRRSRRPAGRGRRAGRRPGGGGQGGPAGGGGRGGRDGRREGPRVGGGGARLGDDGRGAAGW